MIKYCKKCKKKTKNTEHGFEYSNRRHRCTICGYEEGDGKTELDAPIE